MLDVFYTDEVTVRRLTGRDGRNKPIYEEVTEENGHALRLQCKVTLRTRMVRGIGNTQREVDGDIVYRDEDLPEIKDNDLIQFEGKTFRLESINRESHIAAGVDYASARLVKQDTPVPADPHGN